MSKKISEEEYKKRLLVRMRGWISGEKDPYLDNVEIVPQQEYIPVSYTHLRAHET